MSGKLYQVQNGQKVDVTPTIAALTDVSSKADISLGNVNSAGQAAMAHAAMPNWDAYIVYPSLSQGDGWRPLSTPAPADGYLMIHSVLSATSQTAVVGLRVNGRYIPINNYDANNMAMNFEAMTPVNAGDTFEILFKVGRTPASTDRCDILFIYANGTTPTI